MHLPVKHVQSDEVHAAVQSQVSASPPSSLAAVHGFQSSSSVPLQLWHHRLCHPNATKINLLLSQGLISSCNKEPLAPVCSSCQSAKSLQLSFSNSNKCTSSFLELIHSDLSRPSNLPSLSGSPYYVCLWMTTPDMHGSFFFKEIRWISLEKFSLSQRAILGKRFGFFDLGNLRLKNPVHSVLIMESNNNLNVLTLPPKMVSPNANTVLPCFFIVAFTVYC